MTVAPLTAVGIVRYRSPRTRYAKVGNPFARDTRIKGSAAKVALYLLSHRAGFVQTQASIARGVGLCVSTVRAALRELSALRYLVAKIVRQNGRVAGTAYAISDTPFSQVDVDVLCVDSLHRETTPPKKTVYSEKTTGKFLRKGSTPSDPAPEQSSTEDEMVRRKQPAPEEPGLFDVEAPPTPPKPEADPSAKDVVAAYVSSFAAKRDGQRPLKSDVGRVARDAKALIGRRECTVDELVQAATALGKSTYSNLGMALKILREGGKRGSGSGATGAMGEVSRDFSAELEAARLQQDEVLAGDPELAAWLAGDAA